MSGRVADTGAPLFDLTFGADAEARYGAAYLLMHRGDLHQALLSGPWRYGCWSTFGRG